MKLLGDAVMDISALTAARRSAILVGHCDWIRDVKARQERQRC